MSSERGKRTSFE